MRIEIEAAADSVLLGDSLTVAARALNSAGVVLNVGPVLWSSPDSGVLSVSDGVLRGRNVGTVTVTARLGDVVGSRTIRVASRPNRVRMVAPDTALAVTDIDVTAQVETEAGLALPVAAARFAIADTAIAQITVREVGHVRVKALTAGTTDVLAIIGGDTTRRRLVVRTVPLSELSLSIVERTVTVGDSVPMTIAVIDSAGRPIPPLGMTISMVPSGIFRVRNDHLVATGTGRAVIRLSNGVLTSTDTLLALAPSDFALDLVDGDGQNPLPQRVMLAMERVQRKWRTIVRGGPPGERVELAINECRNAVRVSQFIPGVRVLIKLDSLPTRIAGQGGPCVVRETGQPLVGTIQLNRIGLSTLSERKLEDLIQHEVGHVLGIGTTWHFSPFGSMLLGNFESPDPIFVGPNALRGFALLQRSALYTARRVPVELGVLGHWRSSSFGAELMAPALISGPQVTSAVTVGALADLGWTVELEAYDDFALPAGVTPSPRIVGRQVQPVMLSSLAGDMLPPAIVVLRGGRKLRIDAHGSPLLK